jgi:hypothetical protein
MVGAVDYAASAVADIEGGKLVCLPANYRYALRL